MKLLIQHRAEVNVKTGQPPLHMACAADSVEAFAPESREVRKMWVFPKIGAFTIIFTIHFGVPLFLETSMCVFLIMSFSNTPVLGGSLFNMRFQSPEMMPWGLVLMADSKTWKKHVKTHLRFMGYLSNYRLDFGPTLYQKTPNLKRETCPKNRCFLHGAQTHGFVVPGHGDFVWSRCWYTTQNWYGRFLRVVGSLCSSAQCLRRDFQTTRGSARFETWFSIGYREGCWF